MPDIGDTAPDFTLADDRGARFHLRDHRGKPVVVEFYCEDETDGCAVENAEFSALVPEFDKLGAAVVGVSPQSVESHRKFSVKHGFRQPLLADTDLVANQAYDVWQLKKLWGREYMGTVRTTFVIDANGRIAAILRANRIKGHAERVLEAVKALKSGA